MRRSLLAALLTIAILAPAFPLAAQRARLSPHETISQVIGDRWTGNRITITYGRPYAKNPRTGEVRKVWGELVPWDEAYRLGADEATLLLTQEPLVIGDTTIPAGAYTLYLVPSESGTSQLAFSTALGKWGVPVDESHDLARVDATKEPIAENIEQLTLQIDATSDTTGVLRIRWEQTQFSIPFAVKS